MTLASLIAHTENLIMNTLAIAVLSGTALYVYVWYCLLVCFIYCAKLAGHFMHLVRSDRSMAHYDISMPFLVYNCPIGIGTPVYGLKPAPCTECSTCKQGVKELF